MHKRLLAIILSLVVIFAAAVVFISLSGSHPAPVQPVAYNHKVHIESAGLSCVDCHQYPQKLPSAGLPAVEVCATCHAEVPLTESPEEEKVLKYVGDGEEIPWIRIHQMPDHVYFSHRRHVTVGGMECAECHGDVAALTVPVSRPGMPLTMEHCMDCHKQRNVGNDCLTCHR